MASRFWSFREFFVFMRTKVPNFDHYSPEQKRSMYEDSHHFFKGDKKKLSQKLANDLKISREHAQRMIQSLLKPFSLSSLKFQPFNIPLSSSVNASCYFLPPSAVRRASGSSTSTNFYCVSLSSLKKRKCQVTIGQLNTVSGEYSKMGNIILMKESKLCPHNCAYRQVEFCMDEIEGKLYQLSCDTLADTVIISEQKLSLNHDGTFTFDKFSELEYESQFEALTWVASCSQFCIRQAAGPAMFAFAVTRCPENSGTKEHFEFLLCGIQLDRASQTLKIGDKVGQSVFDLHELKPVVKAAQELCLSRSKNPEIWLISSDFLIGNLHSLPILQKPGVNVERYLFSASLGDPTDHRTKRFFHLPNSPEMRLVGKLGKWLVLAEDFDCLSFGRMLSNVNMYLSIKLEELFAASFQKEECVVDMWVVEDEQLFCVQTALKRQEFSGRLHRFSLARVFFELNARQCAHCLKFDENRKFFTDSRKHQSSFKVCRLCKKQNLHTDWLVNKCHFCSVDCFKNGWNEHKKIHKSDL